VLAHPFVGTQVHDGEPELEEQAFSGALAFIDDVDDPSNRSNLGIPRLFVLSKLLADMFQATFGGGRFSPAARPGMDTWAERLLTAANSTVECSGCAGTYYRHASECCWCGREAQPHTRLLFLLWDPKKDSCGGFVVRPKSGDKADIIDHAVVSEANRFTVTARLAFGLTGVRANEPVLEVFKRGDSLELKNLTRTVFRLASNQSGDTLSLGSDPRTITLRTGRSEWLLHFGEPTERHRVLSLATQGGARA